MLYYCIILLIKCLFHYWCHWSLVRQNWEEILYCRVNEVISLFLNGWIQFLYFPSVPFLFRSSSISCKCRSKDIEILEGKGKFEQRHHRTQNPARCFGCIYEIHNMLKLCIWIIRSKIQTVLDNHLLIETQNFIISQSASKFSFSSFIFQVLWNCKF